jgi:hypothetical protein
MWSSVARFETTTASPGQRPLARAIAVTPQVRRAFLVAALLTPPSRRAKTPRRDSSALLLLAHLQGAEGTDTTISSPLSRSTRYSSHSPSNGVSPLGRTNKPGQRRATSRTCSSASTSMSSNRVANPRVVGVGPALFVHADAPECTPITMTRRPARSGMGGRSARCSRGPAP